MFLIHWHYFCIERFLCLTLMKLMFRWVKMILKNSADRYKPLSILQHYFVSFLIVIFIFTQWIKKTYHYSSFYLFAAGHSINQRWDIKNKGVTGLLWSLQILHGSYILIHCCGKSVVLALWNFIFWIYHNCL